jgi:hypothetical protein
MQRKRHETILEKISDKFLKLPSYIQVIVSWIVIIAFIALLLWVNNNYLHISFSGSDECSGRFEYNCGDINDTNIDKEYPEREESY